MKFTRDPRSLITIRQVQPGSIRIGDEQFTQSVVLTHEEVIRNWSPPDITSLSGQDLDRIVRLQPEIVLLGSGWVQRRPPNDFVFALARLGIGLETMDTGAACRTFNILLAEDRRIVAILSVD